MRRTFKFFGLTAAAFFLFFVIVSLAFYHLVRIGEVRRFLIEEIEKQTELKVQLGEADLEIGWITGLAFSKLELSEPGAAQAAITAERVTARVALAPLLQRQVIFYEIHLQKPVLRLVRDAEGKIVLLDRLLNLPFLKRQDSDFNFDLRSIKVKDGDVDFADQRLEGGVGDWRLTRADAVLDRVRGQRLRDLMTALIKRRPADATGTALEFDLNGTLIKDDAKMKLTSRGSWLFPKDELEFRQARWSADVELINFPATLLKEYLGPKVPLKTIGGQLAQRFHVEGNPTERLQVKGELEFRHLAVDAPELLLAPLTGADGKINFEFDWSRQRWQLARADFRANDFRFALQGEVRGLDGDEPHFRLNFSAPSTPLSTLRKYLPLKMAQSPQLEKIAHSFQSGQLEIKNAGVDATVAELRRLTQAGFGKRLWFDAQVREAAGTSVIDGLLPVRAVEGRIGLADGLLTLKNFKCNYGDSRLTDVAGSYDLNPSSSDRLELRARGDVNLAELREQAGMLSAQAAKFAASIQELGGRGKIEISLNRGPTGPVQFDGKAILDNVRLRYNEYALNDLKGEIAFTPREIKSENLRAQMSGSPVQIRIAARDYGADDARFDLVVESNGVKAGVVTSLLLDTGSLQDPGIVRGAVRYAGAFNSKERRKFTGDLEFTNVRVAVHPLLQPLREFSGKITIDEKGVDFQNLKAVLAGFPASASGRWRYGEKPQLLFDFAAPNLDVTYLISQIDPEAGNFYANLQAAGKISLTRGRIKNFDFGDLKTDVTIDHRVWRLTNLTASSSGGGIAGNTTVIDQPGSLGISSAPKIQGVPVQSFLRWFDITNTEMTGRVNLTGNLETHGKNDSERKQNLNGAFNLRIEDGTIDRMRLVVQILNLLDLSRWFTFQLPDLSKQGIRFRAITGDFKVVNGVYATENLVVDSNDLRMTGVGKIDVPKDEIDLVIAVRPFAGVDSVINQIPILGRGIAAIKNSFMVGSFNVTGKIEDPTITPAPLGTISEMFWGILGIPKNMLGLGESEKTEELKEPVTKPAVK